MSKIRKIWGVIAILALATIILVGCSSLPSEVGIADIKANPEAYQGERVTISGQYQGWSGGYGSPPVTRSDWVITDDTGWIYVTGKSAGLDPVNDIGKQVIVVGQVEANTQVYLNAEIITIGE